LVLECLLFWSK